MRTYDTCYNIITRRDEGIHICCWNKGVATGRYGVQIEIKEINLRESLNGVTKTISKDNMLVNVVVECVTSL